MEVNTQQDEGHDALIDSSRFSLSVETAPFPEVTEGVSRPNSIWDGVFEVMARAFVKHLEENPLLGNATGYFIMAYTYFVICMWIVLVGIHKSSFSLKADTLQDMKQRFIICMTFTIIAGAIFGYFWGPPAERVIFRVAEWFTMLL